MRHRLSPGSCLRIAERLRREGATIKGLDLPRIGADDFIDRLDEETERALSGDLPKTTAAWAANSRRPAATPLRAALMRHAGLDVDAVRRIADLLPEWLEIQTTTGRPSLRLREAGPDDDLILMPGAGLWMGASDDRLVITRALPDTIMSDMLVGRALRDVVDHPVINDFDLTIRRAARLEFAAGVELRFSA